MKKKGKYLNFYQSLSDEDKEKIHSFLASYEEHMDIGKTDKHLLLEDAKNALVTLCEMGTSLDEAIKRLSSENLGGFYAHEALAWYPMDDAAVIYPLSMKFGKMPMFRLSCYIKDDVIPDILQIALDFTIKRFPSFATIVRKGFFWHYLDSIKRRFHISEEKNLPCQPLKISNVGTQSFRVQYYKNRISAEFFHVLTDGHGGMIFLKTLVAQYYTLLGVKIPHTDGVFNINTPPKTTELTNDFERFYSKAPKTGGFAGPAALQMSGRISTHSPCKVVHINLDTQKLLDKAHEMGITVTTLVLSLMFIAQRSATEVINGTVQMQVPVNMRKYYKSDSVRNFSMYCSIDLPVEQITTLEEIAAKVTPQLIEKAGKQEMTIMMTTAHKLVKSLRLIPLAIKIPVAKVIYGFLGDGRFSNTLSNIGNITVPEALSPYIQGFDFVLGTCVVSRASCAMITYNGTTVLSVSKNTKDPSFEEHLRTLFEGLGINSQVSETPYYD